jgi:membrane protein implicated in regulation of membrane protease activity
MIYVKSAVAGVIALFLAAGVIYIGMFVAILVISKPNAFDLPIVHLHTGSVTLGLLVISVFTAGFCWEFARRANQDCDRMTGSRRF